MRLNTKDFKMLDKLALSFIAKYVGHYEFFYKLHHDVYTLKLLINFVAYH
jgi:hypothetical protein